MHLVYFSKNFFKLSLPHTGYWTPIQHSQGLISGEMRGVGLIDTVLVEALILPSGEVFQGLQASGQSCGPGSHSLGKALPPSCPPSSPGLCKKHRVNCGFLLRLPVQYFSNFVEFLPCLCV